MLPHNCLTDPCISALYKESTFTNQKNTYQKQEKQSVKVLQLRWRGKALLQFGSGICLWWCWYLPSVDLSAPVWVLGNPPGRLFWTMEVVVTDLSQELRETPESWSLVLTGIVSSAWWSLIMRDGREGKRAREKKVMYLSKIKWQTFSRKTLTRVSLHCGCDWW